MDYTASSYRLVFQKLCVLELQLIRGVCRQWSWLVDEAVSMRRLRRLTLTEHYRGNPNWAQTYSERMTFEIDEYGGRLTVLDTKGKPYKSASAALSLALKLLSKCRRVEHFGLLVDYPQKNELEDIDYIENKTYTKALGYIVDKRKTVVMNFMNPISGPRPNITVGALDIQTDLLFVLDCIKPEKKIRISGYNFRDCEAKASKIVVETLRRCESVSLRFNAGDILSRKLFFSMNVTSLESHIHFEKFRIEDYVNIMKEWAAGNRAINYLTFMMFNPLWLKIFSHGQDHLNEIFNNFPSAQYVDDYTKDPSKGFGTYEDDDDRWVVKITRDDGRCLYFRIMHLEYPLGFRVNRHCWAHYEIAENLQSWYHCVDEYFLY